MGHLAKNLASSRSVFGCFYTALIPKVFKNTWPNFGFLTNLDVSFHVVQSDFQNSHSFWKYLGNGPPGRIFRSLTHRPVPICLAEPQIKFNCKFLAWYPLVRNPMKSEINSLDIKQFSIIPLLIPTKSPRLRSGPQTETANRAVPNGNETANRDRRVLLNI